MVPDPGKTPGINTFKPVNTAEPLAVEEDAAGRPVAVKSPRRYTIEDIEDSWRIDDEWWRSEPVSRRYYAVLLTPGQHLVLYKDLITGRWYCQAY